MIKKTWISALLVVILVLCLCFVYVSTTDSNDSHISLEYSVSICSESTTNVSLLLPIPIKDGSVPSEAIEEIHIISGNCSWCVFESQKGVALLVNGTGNISLSGYFEIEGKDVVYEYDAALSMAQNRTDNYTVWVYNENANTIKMVNITYTKCMGRGISSGSYVEKIDIVPEEGWQMVAVDEEMTTT